MRGNPAQEMDSILMATKGLRSAVSQVSRYTFHFMAYTFPTHCVRSEILRELFKSVRYKYKF